MIENENDEIKKWFEEVFLRRFVYFIRNQFH